MKPLFRSFLCLISVVSFLFPVTSDANIIASNYVINSGSYYYTPSSLTVSVGDTVTWINDGGLHDVNANINSLTGSSFNNPVSFYLPPVNGPAVIGSYVFSIPGTYNYDCSIGNHAANGMVGTIIVLANSGCTDSIANNYDPNATLDDGSCCYNALTSQTYNYTGTMEFFVVPNGVTSISVDACGAKGGNSTGGIIGGFGGRTQAEIPVNPGDMLYIFVGGEGETVVTGVASGGFNGGGNSGDCSGNYAGSGGGGASDIRIGGTDFSDRIIVAGGGGGTHDINNNPGHGGGLFGGDVLSTGNGCFNSYATGGTQSAGGLDAVSSGSCCTGNIGAGASFGIGGDGQGPAVSCNNGDSGAGGGGGYYGGGSGFVYGSGGGGSSYTDPSATNVIHTQGYWDADGFIVISYSQNCDGCTDSLAINYDFNAVVDDGSCCYVGGCTDPIANNYDPSIGIGCDDGSCTYNYGCTDPDANNYDPNATMDDGSCINCNNAAAAIDTFNFTGNLQTYTVPPAITTLTIEAYGAEGGSGGNANFLPGKGAYIKGDVTVSPGDVIDILVGERGYDASSAGGGGGGTFVVLQNGDIPLVIAGGGSGATGQGSGNDGETSNNGGDGDSCPANGGINGNGGGDAANCGSGAGGGGGFYTDGSSGGSWGYQNGFGYLNGGAGGTSATSDAYGGYGGGAGTHSNNTGGGAGGGYSGGGAANHGNGYSGGGGGSYNAGSNQTATAGIQSGNGMVLISYNLSIPECGCMDTTALNYDPVAIYEDSSCCYNYGCTDMTAVNYDPTSDCDDGSCCYEGCTDSVAYNYEVSACVDDGSCCYVTGCTDPASINYDPLACVDDGSCCILAGCTDMMAFNWDPFADCDDGSCCYVGGCTNPISINYDPFACWDDGSCILPCIDPTLIDPSVMCPAIWDPVCGCDNITYANDCEAMFYGGNTSWTWGPCAQACSVEINNGTVDVQICEGGSAYLYATATGGVPPYTYLWTDASTGSLLGTTDAISTTNTGVYLVEMQDATGCVATDMISVFSYPNSPLNPVTVPNPPMICLGDQLVIEVNTGFTDYAWNTGNPQHQSQNSVTVYPTQNFTYIVEAVDINGCQSIEEIQVFVDTCITSVSDINNNLVQIYPNPASNEFFIDFNDSKIYDIEFVDLFGRLLAKEEQVQEMTRIRINDLADGTYLIRIKSTLDISIYKIVVAK